MMRKERSDCHSPQNSLSTLAYLPVSPSSNDCDRIIFISLKELMRSLNEMRHHFNSILKVLLFLLSRCVFFLSIS